jgi:hypothetical protein
MMPFRPLRGRTTQVVFLVVIAIALAIMGQLPALEAQDRSTVIRVLRESRDFRARVRAALALGASADPAMAGPLAGALTDREPAVRVAAASGLGRLGNPEVLPSLRRALTDSSPQVREAAQAAIRSIGPGSQAPSARPTQPLRMPSVAVLPQERDVDWRRVRYVVVLGALQNRSGVETDRLAQIFTSEVQRHLIVLRGIATLRDGVPSPLAEREIARRRLPRIRLEGSINRVQRQVRGRDVQMRCEVSLMVMDEPSRAIRAALNGAATGSERASRARVEQDARLADQALQGAVRSAMSGATQAITSAAHH